MADLPRLLPLHEAAKSGNEEIARQRPENGDDVNADSRGEYTLHEAVRCDRKDLVIALLQSGAAINASDDTGLTPLHEASFFGFLNVTSVLLAFGADIEARDEAGQTPLHKAVQSATPEIALFLVDMGADIQARDEAGQTPPHKAVQSDRLDVANIFLERDADIEARDEAGQTPLHKAVQSARLEVTNELLKIGADVNSVDSRGWSAVQYASEGGYTGIIRLLIDFGAPQSASNSLGQTPMNGSGEELDSDNSGSDIESVISTVFSDISSNSSSSLLSVVPQLAILELATFLWEDSELRSLFESANDKVGQGRFIRNCRRLLGRFGQSLRAEATSDLQHQLAIFVRRRAGQTAIELGEQLTSTERPREDKTPLPENSALFNRWLESQAFIKPEASGAERNIFQEQNNDDNTDYDSDDQLSRPDSDEADNANLFPSTALGAVKEFLISSQALSELRNALRQWLDSERVKKKTREEEPELDLLQHKGNRHSLHNITPYRTTMTDHSYHRANHMQPHPVSMILKKITESISHPKQNLQWHGFRVK
ncbi:hypothetical protein PG988_008033 [Apiospora saccharicola]